MRNIYKTEKPAHLLRVFTIFSLLSLIAILFLVNLGIRRILVQKHINEAEHDAIGISRAIFEHDRAILTSDLEGEVTLNVKPEDFSEVDESMLHFLGPLNIIKIKVFSKNGEIVYSTDHTIIGQIDAHNEKLNRALNGEVVSKLEKKEEVWDIEGEQRFDIDLVETYLPVRDENQKIIGSFEIYLDISRYQEGTKKVLRLSMTVVVVVLVLVFGFLFILMRRGTNELTKNEELLKESEMEYEDLYDNAPDMFLSVDAKTTKIIQCNQTLATALDYTKKEIIGRPVFDMYHPNSLESARKAFKSFVETGEVHNTELQLKRKDGSKIDVSLNVSAVRDEQGNILHSRSILHDITERKKIEKILRESEKRFKSLFNQASDYILVVDPTHKDAPVIVDANDSACKMHGYTREELIGKPISFLDDEDNKKYVPERARILMSGERLVFETVHVRKDGSTFPVEVSAQMIKIGGKPYIYAIERNITERKQAEEQIQLYQEQLLALISKLSIIEEQERRRISEELHDNISQNLAISNIKLATLQKSFPIIAKDLDETRELIEQTIKFARSLIFELSPPILYELGFKAAIEWLTEQFQEKHGILFEFVSNRRLREPTGEMSVLLFKTVRELMLNIVKHAQAQKARVTISKDGDNLQISIEDNGIGFDISKNDYHSIKNGGFGILSIRERIRYLGGTFELTSKLGQGTSVTVIVPLK